MKLRIVLGSIVAVLILGMAAGAYWWLERPQVIVLDDGTELTLLAVTYGKHHALPKNKTGGRKVQNASLTTSNDSICLWVEQKHEQNNYPNFQLLASDPANTGCSGESSRAYGNFLHNQGGDEIMGFAYEAFPRRSAKILFRVQSWNMNNGQPDKADAHFEVRNPAPRGPFPQWTPEKMPDTKEDGDLQATLTRLESTDSVFNFGQSPNASNPLNRGVLAAFRIEQGGILVTNWQPVQIETSDASGNYSKSRGRMSRQDSDEETFSYQWGLWPNEPAWKLRVEMSRQSGYNADETWTATDLPIKTGNMNDLYGMNRKNKPVSETTMGATHLEIYSPTKLSDDARRNFRGQMDGGLRIHAQQPLAGMRLNIVKITDDQGRPVEFVNRGVGTTEFRFGLKNLEDAKTLNITLALHRSRYFEYTVKPAQK